MAAPVYSTTDDLISGAGDGASISFVKFAGLTNGDMVVFALGKENDAAITWPSGFTAGGVVAEQNQASNFKEEYAWKIITNAAGEPANFVASWTGSTWRHGVIFRITGAHQTAPIHAEAAAVSAGADTTSEPVSVTPTVDECLIVHLPYFRDSGTTTGHSGYTEQLDDADNINAYSKTQTTAAAETNIVATNSTAGTNGAILIAIKPPDPAPAAAFVQQGVV